MATNKNEDRRRRLIEAATILFTRYGFKRTSVELLAREASVAKPTVYAYFEDKNAIFRAVVASVCDDLLEAAVRESRSEEALEDRLAAMLSAKFTRYWELVQASPHARELIDSQAALSADIVQRFDRAYLKRLVALLDAATELDLKRAGMSATTVAQVLMRAASGAAYDATTPSSHRKHLAEIVRLIVAAMRRRRE